MSTWLLWGSALDAMARFGWRNYRGANKSLEAEEPAEMSLIV